MRKGEPSRAGARRRSAARKPATGQLAETSEMFGALLDSLDVGVALTTLLGEIVYANARFADMLGTSNLPSVVGARLKKFIAVSSWAALDSALLESRRIVSQGEMRVDVPHGRSRRIRLSMGPWEVPGQVVAKSGPFIRIIATEVTQLLETKRALADSEASLRSLAAQLLKVQDQERRHMARDLHDVTGQELAVAALSLDRAAKQISDSNPEVLEAVENASQLVRKIESEIRTLSYVLHPPLLDEMGLGSALKWYVDGLSKRTGTEIRVSTPDKVPRFSKDKEIALFRVVQEALTNVLRHSNSQRADIVLSVHRGTAVISVRDEGKGFDVGKITARADSGVGIPGMKGRLDLVGGWLQVRSGKRGTEVTATVPLIEEEPSSRLLPSAPRAPSAGDLQASAEPGGSPKRILIADDHEIARRGIRDLFRDQPDLEICGEAKNGLEAVAKAQELRPDLIILDLSMPQLGGFGVAYRIRELALDTKLLIYTTHSLAELERTARAAGCVGYVHKANAARDLVRAVHSVLQGGSFYGADAALTT